jgi:hypothetical protein
VADDPDPDLAIKVEISPPPPDRQGICAALGAAEVGVFDGGQLTIRRRNEAIRYSVIERRGFLPIRAVDVGLWLLDENLSDLDAREQGIRVWDAGLRAGE